MQQADKATHTEKKVKGSKENSIDKGAAQLPGRMKTGSCSCGKIENCIRVFFSQATNQGQGRGNFTNGQGMYPYNGSPVFLFSAL